ncbi:MAG: helix-turn-helix domain-containing protein, partial [Alphaproteobacteria bacterium]|nr:helix-turn-helix domain-containing protein [Alphaproteobacteria bacterium]
MIAKTDKRDRIALFRERLGQAMAAKQVSQSGLARDVGVDRSTISQLLGSRTGRLPNAQVVAGCAAALGVSADWLLGLSDRPEMAADLLRASNEMPAAQRARVDEQIMTWFQEAEGYKIRTVPARLPDFLKTAEMLRWEYEPHLGKTTSEAIDASAAHLAQMQGGRSDYEIAVPLFEVASLVAGEGYYMGLSQDVRKAQVAHLRQLHDALYPKLRIFLFDARQLHSAAVTVFGPLMAVLFLGQHYLAFRDRERVA